MDTHFPSQFPHPLDRVELRTIGRQEIKAQPSPMIPQPGLQGLGTMILGIIQNNHHLSWRTAVTEKMGQEYLKRFSIKDFPLLNHQFPVLQTNGPKHPNGLMRRGVPENGIFDLGRNPHHISRAVLLEMALIQTPKIKIVSSQKLANFFYRQPVLRDLRRPSLPAASDAEIQTDGRCAGIGVPRFLAQRPFSYGGIAKSHPTAPEDIQRRWAAFVSPPPTACADANPRRDASLSPPHPAVPAARLPGIGETNTGWFEGNDPIGLPHHTRSSLGKGRVIHVDGDRIGPLGIGRFPAGKSISQPRDHHISASPWLPPLLATMVLQISLMRN